MNKHGTGRITVTLSIDRIKTLKKEAAKKGLPMPTFCRVLLSEIADESEAKRKAA